MAEDLPSLFRYEKNVFQVYMLEDYTDELVAEQGTLDAMKAILNGTQN